MISILQHIEYLINVNDCVVVPNLGAFIAHYESASFSGLKINAPSRQISFNSAVNHNDGLLVTSIMRRHGLSYNRAINTIDNNVAQLKSLIRNYQEVPIGSLGYLKQGVAGLEFMPFKGALASDFYGLGDFEMMPIVKWNVTDDETSTVQEVGWRQKSVRKAMQWVASVILILGLGFMLSTPVIDNGSQQAGFNIAKIQSPSSTQAKQVVATQDDIQVEQDVAVSNTYHAGRYCLVVATFNSEKMALEYSASKPDMHLWTVKIGKRYRVLAAQSDDKEAVIEAQLALPSSMQSWISD